MYGDAERGNQRLIERSKAEIKTRIMHSQAEMTTALRSSSTSTSAVNPAFSVPAGHKHKLLAACYYKESLLARQYLPFIIAFAAMISAPFIVGLLNQQVRDKVGVTIFIGGLWLFFAIFFLYLLRKRRQSYCLIYDDALLLSHHPVQAHPELDFPQILIPAHFLQWLGPCTAEVNRKIKNAKIPLFNFVPLPYLPMYLGKWALVYSDGVYQYSLIFYPDDEMIKAFRQHFPNQTNYHISSILQSYKVR